MTTSNDKTVQQFTEAKLRANGWTEDYIGLYTHEKYVHCFDLNSGGIEARDSLGYRISMVGEEATKLERQIFIRSMSNYTGTV